MKKIYQIFLSALFLTNLGVASANSFITEMPSSGKVLPTEYGKWVDFIKNKNPELNCPHLENKATCFFLSKVSLENVNNEVLVNVSGEIKVDGKVKSVVVLDDKNSAVMPKRILVNNASAISSKINNERFVDVKSGSFNIQYVFDSFAFKNAKTVDLGKQPIFVQNNIKDYSLLLAGQVLNIQNIEEKPIEQPIVVQEENTNQKVAISVYRKLDYGYPNVLETRINILNTKGNEKVNLGKILPEGFILNQVNANFQLNQENGDFIATLRPGSYSIQMFAFKNELSNDLSISGLINNVQREVWSVNSSGFVGSIAVKDAEKVEPNRSQVPGEWTQLPAYMLQEKITIEQINKGIEISKGNVPLNNVSTRRVSFFGFDDKHMLHVDVSNISGNERATQINLRNDVDFQKVEINGEVKPILKEEDSFLLEIPQNQDINLKLVAKTDTNVPLVLFNEDASLNSWVVYLEPRLRMLGVTGDLKSANTWLNSWDLYKFFAFFFIVFLFYKFTNIKMAALAFFGLLILPIEYFSWYYWLVFFFVLSLLKVAPENSKQRNFLVTLGFVYTVYFVVTFLQFMFYEIQFIFFPMMELKNYQLISFASFWYLLIAILIAAISMIEKKEKSAEETEDGKVKKEPFTYKKLVLWVVGTIVFLVVVSTLMSTGKDAVFGSNDNLTYQGNVYEPSMAKSDMTGRGVAEEAFSAAPMLSAPATASVLSREIRVIEQEEIFENMNKKNAFVGMKEPDFSIRHNGGVYYMKSTSVVNSSDKEARFLIMPRWLVNIFGVIQIAFMLVTLLWFTSNLVYKTRKDWFEKVPSRLRGNKWFLWLIN